MEKLKSAHCLHKVKFMAFINIVIFIVLSCIYQYNNNKNIISGPLENGRKLNISLDMRNYRTLAKHERQHELMNARFSYKIDDNSYNHKLLNGRNNNNTYERLKRGKPNNVESYLNSFKYRHSKKGGLKKLDCYYEKKFFKSLEKIEKLAQQKNISEKKFKKIICKKYGVRFILLALLPLFGLILPVIYFNNDHIKGKCIKLFEDKNKTKLIGYWHKNCTFFPPELRFLNCIFFTALSIIIILFIIYTYVKILKYKRIKSGMQK